MKPVTATALSVGILGAICTWTFLSIGTVLVWAAFVAWACFFQSGGDDAALKNTIVSNIFGCFMGWLGAVMILGLPIGDLVGPQIWSATVVFITVVIYILASQIPALASVPGTTFGYACTFAFLLQTPDRLALPKLLSASFDNSLVVVPVSMVAGALFGFVSAKLAAALTKPSLAPA
ncbi:DUF1097 domain-containing protein [Mesorhizobium helmanticense]|nr:DUF1097 domain-containing protein [Mesorhizobium helmanticense]